MKNLNIAVRSLFKKGRHNGMKIISLSVGLSVSLVLIAKIYFEQSYDTFYPEADRIYRLTESFTTADGSGNYAQVPGAVAVGMKAEVPGIEDATRLTYIAGEGTTFTTPEKERYFADYILMADSNVFDVLEHPVLSGNPKEVLARPWHAMISRSLAEKMGGIDAVNGMEITPDDMPGMKMTVGGVFEDLPDNSHLRFDMLVSLNGMSEWSRTNWVGNDRYLSYVRLSPGVDPESLKPAIHEMQLRHIDQEEMKKAGVELSFFMKPLLEMHSGNDEVENMMMMLAVLAFALLFTAVMNYILVAISSIVSRTKEVAVHKSYGASEGNIYGMMMSETFVHMVIALLLSVFLIFLCRDVVEELLEVSVANLLLSKGVWLLLAICAVVFLVTGCVPGFLFARIPVASAFRNFRESRRIWKLGLLFLQFIAAGLLVTLLMNVARQHQYMIDDDPGYAYDRLAYCSIAGLDSTRRAKVSQELMRLPEVEMVSTAYELPLKGMSGNNISLPGSEEQLFNVADQYWVGNGYLELMEIPVIEGRSFTENVAVSTEIMVNRAFAEKIQMYGKWPDGPVGKQIFITGHDQGENVNAMSGGNYTICGVYENYRIGSLASLDDRPSVLFYSSTPSPIQLVKFKALTGEAIDKVNLCLQELMPDRNERLSTYSADVVNLYRDSRKFRDEVMIGGLITLIISLIGLIGYTNDEINRRSKELAIRKVNGAASADIIRIFVKDIMSIAVPAVLIGCVSSYFISDYWQEQFQEKVSLHPAIFIVGAILVWGVVAGCVLYRTWTVANSNPVESLKSE